MDSTLSNTLLALFGELVDGPPEGPSYMLNHGDVGLLRSLDALSPEEASAAPRGGASVAAHVDHLLYYLRRMSRHAAGEQLETADWAASWQRGRVSEDEWATLREELAEGVARWRQVLGTPGPTGEAELRTRVASIAHLAYHLGALRQISRRAQGPRSSH